MRNPFRRLLPRRESHLLLARPASAPPPEVWVDGVRLQTVASPDDPHAATLDAFAATQGFPTGWAADMLTDGAAAIIAVNEQTNQPLAMGWATRRPFFVAEIDATLDPAGGLYLFGDFVAPPHRGRRLQHLLVSERLRILHPGLKACTIIAPDNLPSLHSYRNAGFAVTDQFTRSRWLRRTWTRCRRARSGPRPAFELSQDQSTICYK